MRDATKQELAWCRKLSRLMRSMPKTMALFADGQLKACCARELRHQPRFGRDTLGLGRELKLGHDEALNEFHERDEFQPLSLPINLGNCEGGDPWK